MSVRRRSNWSPRGPVYWSSIRRSPGALFRSARDAAGAIRNVIGAYRNSPYLYGPFGTTLPPRPMRARRTAVSTPGGTVRFARKIGAAMSKSAGFVKKGKSKKKYMKKKLVKYAVQGCNKTIESSKVLTGQDTVWVGHGTFVRDNILRQAVVALFYKMFSEMDMIRNSIDVTQLITGTGTASTITVAYRLNPQTNAGSEVYTAPVGGTSLALLADWFLNAARPWMDNFATNYEAQFTELIFTDVTVRKTFLLDSCTIQIFVKSALKMQNRSQSATAANANDEEAVDNVPVYGKSYSGKGTTLRAKAQYGATGQDLDLNIDRQFGVTIGSESLYGRKEPPQPKDFVNVSHCGKIRMDPGEIKTSVLQDKFAMNFSSLFRACAYSQNPSVPAVNTTFTLSTPRLRNLGKFRVFCVEKMISINQNSSPNTAPAISIAFENNVEISATVKFHKRKGGVIKEFAKYDI